MLDCIMMKDKRPSYDEQQCTSKQATQLHSDPRTLLASSSSGSSSSSSYGSSLPSTLHYLAISLASLLLTEVL